MPAFGPVSRTDFIYYLRELGFAGPKSGGKHQFMIRDRRKLRIPNPHAGDISRDLLGRILREAAISREEWERL
ncbi:MAG: type II toxin-antitoxin system HicA family toxin [Bryobacteraceae bacterium]